MATPGPPMALVPPWAARRRRLGYKALTHTCALVLLTPMFGNAWAPFAGAPRAPLRTLRSLSATFIDDIGEGMRDASLVEDLGISTEEGSAVFEKCKSGNMTFQDFVTVTRFLHHLSGNGGMVPQMAALHTDLETKEMDSRIQEYRTIIAGMEPREQLEPRLLLAKSSAAYERLKRLATVTDRSPQAIDQFLLEYKTMRKLLRNFGAGRTMEDTTSLMSSQQADEQVGGRSREFRRKALSKARRKRKPEWLKV